MRNNFFAVFFLLLAFFQLMTFTVNAQNPITLDSSKVIYQLPYPGLLPDHPLYFFKHWRDNMMIAGTRDNLKKAQLYHLLSDKDMSMALDLQNKGKEQLAIKTVMQGEEKFLKIIPLLKTSQKQGVRPAGDFMTKLQNSNLKHREVIEDLLKKTSQSNADALTNILETNAEIRQKLEKIK